MNKGYVHCPGFGALLSVRPRSRADSRTTRTHFILYARDPGAAEFGRLGEKLVKIAIIDDWQGVAQSSADWSRLVARAELIFFADAFGSEDDAALALADFDINA